ncbi:XF1762 family protein [Streptomyces ardesiacus]|uniref:XF1762 family protein n=1 Tax=Streptomyces ardesiacus TaxID=285564 RepID=A0ABW8H4Z6_9ACTN
MSDTPLNLVPVRSREAKNSVRAWHRHHPSPSGQIFTVAAADGIGILGTMSIVGRRVARHLDDDATLEATRATSAIEHECSRSSLTAWSALAKHQSPCSACPSVRAEAPEGTWPAAV